MKITWIIILMIMGQFVFAQEEYNVVAVKGSVVKKETGVPVKPGDKLRSNGKIVFASPDAAVLVVSRSKGRFVLKQDKKASSGLFRPVDAVVRDYLHLSTGNLSTRSGVPCNKLDFQNYFQKSSLLIIGDTAQIKVCKDIYPISDTTFFYITYLYKGESIAKPLNSDKDNILLIKDSIFKVDENPVDSKEVSGFELYYRYVNQSVSEKICAFDLRFVPGPELKQTLTDYLKYIDQVNLSKDQQIDSLKSLIHDFYGVPDDKILLDWLDKNIFAVKK